MHLNSKISHSHAFGGSEVINLSQHRKEGWTRHILDHRRYILLDLLVHAKLFVPERTK